MKAQQETAMLKEVGASGQISLGKKYAGQLFEVDMQPDGSIIMRPMKVVPASHAVQESTAAYGQTPPPETPGRQAAQEWAQANAVQIEQYNAWATQREPYSQRVRRWREQGEQGEQGQQDQASQR